MGLEKIYQIKHVLKCEAGEMFDNIQFNNYFDLVRQCKNRSFYQYIKYITRTKHYSNIIGPRLCSTLCFSRQVTSLNRNHVSLLNCRNNSSRMHHLASSNEERRDERKLEQAADQFIFINIILVSVFFCEFNFWVFINSNSPGIFFFLALIFLWLYFKCLSLIIQFVSTW